LCCFPKLPFFVLLRLPVLASRLYKAFSEQWGMEVVTKLFSLCHIPNYFNSPHIPRTYLCSIPSNIRTTFYVLALHEFIQSKWLYIFLVSLSVLYFPFIFCLFLDLTTTPLQYNLKKIPITLFFPLQPLRIF
jgi:hypothetical protein